MHHILKTNEINVMLINDESGDKKITFASLQRESIETVQTNITRLSTDSWLTIALTRIMAAICVSTSDRIALTTDAAARRLQIPKTIDALIACATRHIFAAETLTRVFIARSTQRTIWTAATFYKREEEQTKNKL